jgi:hypothetical protein
LFPFDFESAVPNDVFYNALVENGLLNHVTLAEYISKVSSAPLGRGQESIKHFISREYCIDINNSKILIGKSIARHYGNINSGWWQDENFIKTDFGRFLKFIISILK